MPGPADEISSVAIAIDQPGLATMIDGIGSIADRLGTFGAYVAIIDLVRQLIPAARAQVMYYPRFSLPRYLYETNTPIGEQAIYRQYYRFDPFYKHITALSEPAVLQLRPLLARSLATDVYMSVFYPQTGAVDEIAMLLPAFGGGVVGLFCQAGREYRDCEVASVRALLPMIAAFHRVQDRLTLLSARTGQHQGGYDRYVILLDEAGRETFRSPEMARLERVNPGLGDAIAHLAVQPSGSRMQLTEGTLHIADLGDGIVSQQGGRICFFHAGPNAGVPRELTAAIVDFLRLYGLSPRQRDILELTLLGCSAYNIAQRLDLSEGTVRNHRKQIYDKLDVTTEREIFAMFLRYIAADSARSGEEGAKRIGVATHDPFARMVSSA